MEHYFFCKNCEVELDNNMKVCPLCGTSIYDENNDFQKTENYPASTSIKSEDQYLTDYNTLNPSEKRKLFWELTGIVIFSGIIATLAINLIISNNVKWAKYCIIILLCIFANITLITFFPKKIYLLLPGSFISNAILVLLIATFNENINWAVGLGMPILFSFYLITAILILLIRKAKQKSLNVFALFLIAAGVYCLFVEGIISYYYTNLIKLHWSVIVLVSIAPVASVLFYIHYRLKRGVNLKRFFHI